MLSFRLRLSISSLRKFFQPRQREAHLTFITLPILTMHVVETDKTRKQKDKLSNISTFDKDFEQKFEHKIMQETDTVCLDLLPGTFIFVRTNPYFLEKCKPLENVL